MRTGISSGTLRLVIEYGLPLPFLQYVSIRTHQTRDGSPAVNSQPIFWYVVVTNDKLQGSVATRQCSSGVVNSHVNNDLLLSLPVRKK